MRGEREVVAAVFPSAAAAEAARRSLRELERRVTFLKLGAIAVVTRREDGRTTIRPVTGHPLRRGALVGLLVGGISAAVIAAPLGVWAGVSLAVEELNWSEAAEALGPAAIFFAVLGALGAAFLGAALGAAVGLLLAALTTRHVARPTLAALAGALLPGQAALALRLPPPMVEPALAGLVRGGEPLQAIVGDPPAFAPRAVAPLPDPSGEDLILATFPSGEAARAARQALRRMDWRVGSVALGNLALVERRADGGVRFDQRENLSGRRGALFGGLVAGLAAALVAAPVGALLGGFLLLALARQTGERPTPDVVGEVLAASATLAAILAGLVGVSGGAILGGGLARLANFAIRGDDLTTLGQQLPPGHAALVTLVSPYEVAPVAAALRPHTADLAHNGVPLGVGDPAASLAVRLADRGRFEGGAVPPVRRLVTTASGVRLFCVEHRVSDHHVVLLHGAGGDHLAWAPQLPALHAAGLSTLLLDLRGHGYSDRPTRPEDYLLGRFAEDVADVLEALGVNSFILVGHCFGGMVATIYHSLHPDRSKGYLLLDTAAQAPAALAVVARRTPFLLGAVNRLAGLVPDYRQRIFQADMEQYKGGGDRALGRLLSDVQHTRLGTWINVFGQGVGRYDGVAALKSMSQPVWVAVGADDTVFTVADSAIIHGHVPGSKLITVAGANHIIVVNNPEVVERLILDFIRDHAIFDAPVAGGGAPRVADAARHAEEECA